MIDPSEKLIQLAREKNLISESQATLLNEEISMFPGSKATAIMLKRGMISPDQVQELEAAAQNPPEDDQVDPDFDLNLSSNPSKVEPLFPGIAKPEPMPENKAPSKPLYSGLSSAISAATEAIGNTQKPAYTPVNQARQTEQKLRPLNLAPRPPVIGTNTRLISTSSGSTRTSGISPDPLILKIFKEGRERGCSDLHLTPGQPPYFRQNGKIFFLEETPLSAATTERLNRSVLTAEQQEILKRDQQLDFSFGWDGVGRFRANVYQQKLGYEGSFRFVPAEIPTLDSLGLPKILEKLTTYTQGLNLVTGPSGSGKTSTVAAMLEHINRHRPEHIITVEDPVEYVFVPQQCQITQREVGTHTESFATALRTALRQDPDVIMIGELRDLDTTSISITAAETGHLVFGTLHTPGVIRTVARILDVFPSSQRSQICVMVAESLRGITSQQLIDRKDGKGRVAAVEILLATTGVAQVIKEGKTHQLVSNMQSGRKLGMISMEDAIMELLQSGTISGKDAYTSAENKTMFENVRNQS